FQQTLQGAVFTEGAVQHREDDIQLRQAVQPHAGTVLLAGYLVKFIAGGVWQHGRPVQALQITVFKSRQHTLTDIPLAAVRDTDLDHFVPAAVQCVQHRARRHERHFMFARTAAEDYTGAKFFTCFHIQSVHLYPFFRVRMIYHSPSSSISSARGTRNFSKTASRAMLMSARISAAFACP